MDLSNSRDIQHILWSLRKSGWSPDRRVETAAFQEDAAALGYSGNRYAAEFLAEFGGLELMQKGLGVFDFNPKHSEYKRSTPGIQDIVDFTKFEVCVLGNFNHYAYTLLVDERNRFFVMHPSGLASRIGRGVEAAFEFVFFEDFDLLQSINLDKIEPY